MNMKLKPEAIFRQSAIHKPPEKTMHQSYTILT